ncbi:MAG: STAS domain-containing protein [Chromatiales bacterium]|jgi:anti-anti-sigma factor
MSDSKVYYAFNNGIHILKYVGQIRYTIGASLDRFIDGLFDGTPPEGFVVDLREAETIDSTNLGLLVLIAKRMARCEGPRVTLVSTHEDINDLLFSIGFDEVFDIVDESGHAMLNGRELGLSDSPSPDMARTILEAHRTLSAMGDSNRARFQDVVDLLERNPQQTTHEFG